MWEELRNLMQLVKQGPQGPQKLSSIKSLEIQITPTDTGYYHPYNHHK